MYIIYEMEYKLVQLCKLTEKTGIMYRALEVHDLKGLGMHHLAAGPITMLRKITAEVRPSQRVARKFMLTNPTAVSCADGSGGCFLRAGFFKLRGAR